ncbi:MAG: DUF971 domain-containing protein [Planctomycetota bacterium]|nr:DUF971 domain-containing protein [Planctomycetota bacterium]
MELSTRIRADVVELLKPAMLLIVWGDGHESLFPHRPLRESCECAACIDEWSRKPILDPKSLPVDLHCTSFERTGRYGLNLTFSDGHGTGIWSLDRLRAACPCPECEESRT